MSSIIKRFGVLLIGILSMSAGIALSRLSLLGTSPISSVPNVVSNMTSIPIGQLTILLNFVLVFFEALILRRDFSWKNILQLVPGSLFGLFIDAFVSAFSFIPNDNYLEQVLLVLVGTTLLAFGVFLEVNSHAIIMPGEGLPNVIALVYHIKFAKVKVYNDFTLIIIAAALALVFTHSLSGIREGTLFAAFFTGRLVSWFSGRFVRFTDWMELEAS